MISTLIFNCLLSDIDNNINNSLSICYLPEYNAEGTPEANEKNAGELFMINEKGKLEGIKEGIKENSYTIAKNLKKDGMDIN
ncbi:hypothetical protein [Brachyspira catarrhinii]|uniref:hypothetical protein n=1 Tax=Brachyspira catarrhinii TaxID=2528966 RepID=UPI0013A599FA|nr:hypothetical protein [Brachyspira catarrhinii]